MAHRVRIDVKRLDVKVDDNSKWKRDQEKNNKTLSELNTERITDILIVLSDFIKYLLPVTPMFLSLGKNMDWQLDL